MHIITHNRFAVCNLVDSIRASRTLGEKLSNSNARNSQEPSTPLRAQLFFSSSFFQSFSLRKTYCSLSSRGNVISSSQIMKTELSISVRLFQIASQMSRLPGRKKTRLPFNYCTLHQQLLLAKSIYRRMGDWEPSDAHTTHLCCQSSELGNLE